MPVPVALDPPFRRSLNHSAIAITDGSETPLSPGRSPPWPRPKPMFKINVSKGDPVMSTENPTAGYRIGYARVSTLEQYEALQQDALIAAGCQRVFVDKASGKLEHRQRSMPCSIS
jgi:hypothetical protein